MEDTRKALVLGATGLIGREVVNMLLAHEQYESVTVLVRRKLDKEHPKLIQVIADFDHLEQHHDAFKSDDVFSCLGTTIKKAKTKENFKKVDYEYTIKAAELAAKNGAARFLTVSSLGADSTSIFFYNKVKGMVEDKLKKIPLHAVHVFQPSLLLGDRDEHRTGEKMAENISAKMPFIFKGPLRKYKPVSGRNVAFRMVEKALQNEEGYHVHRSDAL
ncbi:NAD(P)H-binding protein [Fictibacillus iocasae]|uniref:NAD(P)H-binding protein n=1 Tax=Fictibacillus iocasae TaxID=2715437 RepID=A0ABW2NNT9_9BACL